MKFTKPALTFEEQAALLRARGMEGDPAAIAARLAMVNYYRLSAYWQTFQDPEGRFHAGTTFTQVWERYTFDRGLRLFVMDALERFEVAVRAQLAYEHAHAHGPFGYATDPAALFATDPTRRAAFFAKLDGNTRETHERFARHFRERYGDEHDWPPIWMATELLSFGGLFSLYRGSAPVVQRRVSSSFGVAAPVFESWLRTLNLVRNICAHHGRLWNRELALKPKLPRREADPAWHHPVSVAPDRMFAVLTILAYTMERLAPGSTWGARLRKLFDAHPNVPLRHMGFPKDWEHVPIWTRVLG